MTTVTATKPTTKNTTHPNIATATHVLQLEIEGIEALIKSLDQKFLAAVELIAKTKGRLIISGMGKSGHVARKIAATMASTGTPAFFVHPGEASHGDLGMITTKDAVMLLSNSGETSELMDIINYCKRYSIPMIGVARRQASLLAEVADIPLVLPEIPEASTVAAPTTSTTMMMALGDAIAIALLEQKGFNREDFHVFHPGGKLGSQFLKVKDLMHKDDKLPLVSQELPMSEVLLEMTSKGFGSVAVVDLEQKLIGIITDGDLRRHMSTELVSQPASEVMTRNPITISSNALATEALHLMEERSITGLFILDNGKVEGILHIHDLLRAGVA